VMLGRKPGLGDVATGHCRLFVRLTIERRASTRDQPEGLACQLGRYTWISHYATDTLDLGQQFWWRYRYSGDLIGFEQRLPDSARRHGVLPKSRRRQGKDGKYHIYPTNARESFWAYATASPDLP